MKKYEKILQTCVLCFIVAICSCKKENNDTPNNMNLSGRNRIMSFITSTQITATTIDTVNQTVSVTASYATNLAAVTADIQLAPGATATINGNKFQGGRITLNCNLTPLVSVTAQNGSTALWTITVTPEDMQAYGLGSVVTASKSLDRKYNWYIDQGNTGPQSLQNCVPSCVTMAAEWADSTFSKTAADARNTYPEGGGGWYSSDATNYLKLANTSNGMIFLGNTVTQTTAVIENCIDQGDLVILLLDNFQFTYNTNTKQHTGRFYPIFGPNGHCVLVKGYKRVDNQDYFDVYDPDSLGDTYPLSTALMGQDRYYTNNNIFLGTYFWDSYGIIVAPKGKQITIPGAYNIQNAI
jgi:hypothetical protein